jgi:hypothetical protein
MADYPRNAWDGYRHSENKYPIRRIRNGVDILEMQDNGEEILIGHTLSWCDEQQMIAEQATGKAEEFYNELVENGLRVIPKSQEEMLTEALNAIQYLAQKVDKLEGEKYEHKHNNTISKESKPKNSKHDRQEPSSSANSPESPE